MLLAIDTATLQAGIALYDGNEVRAELLWQAGRHHTEMMAPAIRELLLRARCRAADLTAVAVSLGPGSFTGLRIGLALAKGLAAANALGIVGIPTLDATAYPFLMGTSPVCALLQMGRGRVAFSLYPPDTRESHGVRTGALADAMAGVQVPTLFAGELLPDQRAALQAELGSLGLLPPPALALRRPGYVAELAWQRLARGESDDLHTLGPLYAESSPAGRPT